MTTERADHLRGRTGLYACDKTSDEPATVGCVLEIGPRSLPIEIPQQVLEMHSHQDLGVIRLRVPGRKPLPVEAARHPTPSEQRWAEAWLAEMEAFDRY